MSHSWVDPNVRAPGKDCKWGALESDSSHTDSAKYLGLLSNPTASLIEARATQESTIPFNVTRRLLHFMSPEIRRSLRLTCRAWCLSIDNAASLSRPIANTVPREVLRPLLSMMTPRDFDNARKTCSEWMRVSLDENLLEGMLKRAGCWDSWLQDYKIEESTFSSSEERRVWGMSRRLTKEFVLSNRQLNVERAELLTTTVVDFSNLSQRHPGEMRKTKDSTMPTFQVSICGNYLLVMSGFNIYVYRLFAGRSGNPSSSSTGDVGKRDIALVATIKCRAKVLASVIDTGSSTFVVAALLSGRMGFACNLVSCNKNHPSPESADLLEMPVNSYRYYDELGTTKHPPDSLSLCPMRKMIAFTSFAGVDVREGTLPDGKGNIFSQSPRTIPGNQCCLAGHREDKPNLSFAFHHAMGSPIITASDCRTDSNTDSFEIRDYTYYQPIHVYDTSHVPLVGLRGSLVYLRWIALFNGRPLLTKPLEFAPPSEELEKDGKNPTIVAAGSDLRWGLRLIAVYKDHIVLYSIPHDVLDFTRENDENPGLDAMGDSDLARDYLFPDAKKRNYQGHDCQESVALGDWECLFDARHQETAAKWPLRIYGNEIARMENVVKVALQTSHGGARVWLFSASGKANIIDVDNFTSGFRRSDDIPCKVVSLGTEGEVNAANLINRAEVDLGCLKLPRELKKAQNKKAQKKRAQKKRARPKRSSVKRRLPRRS